MTQQKFCKDCKHYKRSLLGEIFSDCVNPKQGADLSSGKLNTHRTWMQRLSGWADRCGKNAVWFEPKEESWFWKKLSGLLTKLRKKAT